MEENKSALAVDKIIIKPEDELIDIVRKISSSKAQRIVLKFPDESDILISPINFKVIQKVTDKLDKLLIAQILNSPSGLTNAQLANVTTSKETEISEDLWTFTAGELDERKNSVKKALKGEKDTVSSNEITEVDEETDEETEKADTIEIERMIEEEGFEKITESKSKEDEETEENRLTQSDEPPVEKSDFEKKVAQTLSGLKPANTQLLEENGFEIAIDDDIENFTQPLAQEKAVEIAEIPKQKEDSQKVVSKDDSRKIEKEIIETEKERPNTHGKNEDVYSTFISKDFKSKPNIRHFKSKSRSKKISLTGARTLAANTFSSVKQAVTSKTGYKKLIPLAGGTVVLAGIVFYFIYSISSQATAIMYYESNNISADRVFEGTLNSAFSLEENKLAVISHEIKKESSESSLVTGTGERGKKATGTVTIRCFKDSPVVLEGGTKIKTADNREFAIASTQNLDCPTTLSGVIVEALNYGSEYNVQSGTPFTVAGHASSEVNALNNTAFTGGTKETYSVISQEDVDNITEGLTEPMNAEAKEELEGWSRDEGWVILPGTIKHQLDGDPEPDAPVGSETDIVNVVVKTKHSAYYYNKKDLENAVSDVIREEALSSELYAEETAFQTSENTEVDYELIKGDRNGVEIRMTVTSTLKPDISKEKIVEDIQGKSWKEGLEYINDLDFHAEEPRISFSPSWIPKFLWKFPRGNNKVIVHIREKS